MNLKSAQVISTGPFPAQRFGWSPPISRETRWTNDGSAIRIWKSQVWMGMDIGGRGDFWFRLERVSDGSPLAHTNWDHYAEPSGASGNLVLMDYAPNWFEIEHENGLRLTYGAKRWNPIWPLIMRGDLAVTIWYTFEENA